MTLNAELYKNKNKIASFSLFFSLTDLFAENVVIFDKDTLPIQNDNTDFLLTEWLRKRAIKITEKDTDEDIMDFYGCVYKYTLGRMLPYTIGKAILQYMESNDGYFITPIQTEVVWFGSIDERFAKMFIFTPKGVNK